MTRAGAGTGISSFGTGAGTSSAGAGASLSIADVVEDIGTGVSPACFRVGIGVATSILVAPEADDTLNVQGPETAGKYGLSSLFIARASSPVAPFPATSSSSAVTVLPGASIDKPAPWSPKPFTGRG